MQAMLMAFITMNMSNSGIPSTKANSISRTFPPLFIIKIPEEEQIALFLKKVIRECLGHDFLHHDLQFITFDHSITFMYVEKS